MPATARPAPVAAAPRRAAPHAPLPAPSSSIPSARRDPGVRARPAPPGRAIAPALRPRTSRAARRRLPLLLILSATLLLAGPAAAQAATSVSLASGSLAVTGDAFRNDILVTRQAGGYRVSDQLAALQLVPEPTPVRGEMHVAALTGTPLAPARRRRFTNMSQGPIMSTLGIVLMLVGAALAAAEVHVPSHGALGGAAAVAVAAGIALVVAGAGVGTAVAVIVGLAAGMVAAGYAWVVVRKGLAASRHRLRSGSEGLVGRVGEVRAAPAPVGQVFLDGALWRARVWAADEDAALQRGDPIVVERVDGLTLTVRRAEEWEVAP